MQIIALMKENNTRLQNHIGRIPSDPTSFFLNNPIFPGAPDNERETQAQNRTIFLQMSKNDSSNRPLKPSISRWKWSFLQDVAICKM